MCFCFTVCSVIGDQERNCSWTAPIAPHIFSPIQSPARSPQPIQFTLVLLHQSTRLTTDHRVTGSFRLEKILKILHCQIHQQPCPQVPHLPIFSIPLGPWLHHFPEQPVPVSSLLEKKFFLIPEAMIYLVLAVICNQGPWHEALHKHSQRDFSPKIFQAKQRRQLNKLHADSL